MGTPRRLFTLPNGVLGPAQLSSIATSDGQRFVWLVQLPAAPASASTAQR